VRDELLIVRCVRRAEAATPQGVTAHHDRQTLASETGCEWQNAHLIRSLMGFGR
jgi:hypothetical protein